MTPVDALDTMLLMGMKDEATSTKNYIIRNLKFDKDIYVQNFEITIRLLGGLLSAYQLTGDERLLSLAEDLGTRLLPVFNSPTGLPYRYVNLRTGKVRGEVTNPAETGTLLIEFGTLSKLTNKPVFYEKAKRALVETYLRRSPIGLIGTRFNVETGKWTNTDSHISAEIDSYYEYLLKCWLLFDDQDCRRMWRESIGPINKYLADTFDRDIKRRPDRELWYGHADMNTGKRTATTYGALDAFFPSVLALSGDLGRARQLQSSSFQDVGRTRNRTGGVRLQEDGSSQPGLSTTSGNCRVDLLSLSLHSGPSLLTDGRDALPRLRKALQNRGRICRVEECGDKGEV